MKWVSHLFSARNDNIIVVTSKPGLLKPERLANRPLYFVTLNRGTARLERNPKPKVPQVVLNAEDGAFGETKHFALGEKTPILPRIVQSVFVS